MATSIDDVTALERAYEELERVVADLTSEQLTLPTNCPEWDVRGLLNHTLGTSVMFTLVNAGRAVGEDAGDVAGNDPIGALAKTSADNVASWRDTGALEGMRTYPWGTLPATAALVVNVGEIALHAWDLAKATGQHAHIDADVAQIVYDLYSNLPMDDMRANGVYGPEIAVPESAPVQDRLLGFLSREL